ncbi:MAG: cation diffusion facilitator family transporter [Dehalococcoidia bacterium]
MTAERKQERPVAVIAALIGNALIAVTKGFAALVTGSGALLAETAHSIADTLNQVLLYVGVQRSQGGPSERYPLGRGKERYFWALVVALMLFFGGGVFSLVEAWDRARTEHPVESVAIGLAVLGASAIFEAASFSFALREALEAARGEGLGIRGLVFGLSDPALRTVLMEDSAALVGLLIAALGLIGTAVTGNEMFDVFGSASIGLLLVSVAILLAADARGLIIGESPRASVRAELHRVVAERPNVETVHELRAVRFGVDRLLVLGRVGVRPSMDAAEVARVLADVRQAITEARPEVIEVIVDVDVPREANAPAST